MYLSPWDGPAMAGEAYNDFYINQLVSCSPTDVFSVWLDGACGEVQRQDAGL